MLPPFIIEQIRRREEQERRERAAEQPRLDLPLERPASAPRRPELADDEPERGVIVIDLG